MTPEIAGAAAMLGSAMTHAVMGMLTKSSSDKLVFGAILAALILKESFGAKRTLLAILLAAGLVLLQIG